MVKSKQSRRGVGDSPTRLRLLAALALAPAWLRRDGGCITRSGEAFQRSAVRGVVRSGRARYNVIIECTASSTSSRQVVELVV